MKSPRFISLTLMTVLSGCTQSGSLGSVPSTGGPASRPLSSATQSLIRSAAASSKIQHVVIIIQENRSVDNLFQFLPGANTQSYGLNSQGQDVPLQPADLAAPYTSGHVHTSFLTEYNNGAMNGFDLDTCKGTCPVDAAYGYVPRNEVEPYYTMAKAYTFADEMFQTNQGPSFPAHQYLVSGTSTTRNGTTNRASNNPETADKQLTGGCDSPAGSLVPVINAQGEEPASLRAFPCFKRKALMNLLDQAGISWRYYQAKPGPGIWNAVDPIYSIWSNQAEFASNVVAPSSKVLTDIAHGHLADVVWVTPTLAASDHPKWNNGSGPSWVASVVNAIGESQYWNTTAIFVTWDDWGGWYDHVTPQILNSYELGFRVPLIVISPYARVHYVSHKPHEFGSLLKFTEKIFGLRSLDTTDKRADDLFDCFDFNKQPAPFKPIPAKYPPKYFFTLPSVEPDD
ncbi:MAG: alkaline phosphatase family protein [Candidatus Cybelea sp.]